jgi:anaerobic selenocysteine-containing dehydrogenase
MTHDARTVPTFCRICEASCGLLADVEGGRVLRLRPDPEHVVSRGFACVKGLRYGELHGSPDRLRTPLKRVGEQFVPISWDEALAEIGAKLAALRSEHGPDAAGVYIGNPTAFSISHAVFAGGFMKALGGRHLYTSGSQDCNNKFVAAEEMLGSPLLQAIPDLDRARMAILVGTNPAVSQLSFVHMPRAVERLKALAKRGRLVHVNPRRTETAEQAGEHLPIRPGSDVFFFLAFAALVCAEVAPGSPRLAHVEGFDELAHAVAPFTPERVAPHTGIDPGAMRQLVADYLAADGAVLYAGTGVNQGPHGTLSLWLLTASAILAGQFERPGALIMTRQQRRTARFGAPHGDAIQHREARMGDFRSVLDSLPAGVLPDEILTPGPGQLRALFVTAGNPVLSCPNSARMAEALRSLPLLVCLDLFRNETGNLAHYVLPTTSFLERADVPMAMAGYQPEPYVQLTEAVVPPAEGCREEWWIFTRLAEATGLSLFGSRAFHAYASASAKERIPRAFRFSARGLYKALCLAEGVTPWRLARASHGHLTKRDERYDFLAKGVLRASKRVQLAPARFLAALAPLAEQLARAPEKSLQLITKRERHSHNSWMHNLPARRTEDRAGNFVYMHPSDAAARGLVDGALCRVRSAVSELCVPVRCSDALTPGAVALPHGWGHGEADGLREAQLRAGVNANLLAPDGPEALEALSGMARLTAIAVEITRA